MENAKRRFYDIETDEVVSFPQLAIEFLDFMTDEERNGRTLDEYINDCCGKNGTLTEIPEKIIARIPHDFEPNVIIDDSKLNEIARRLYLESM